MALTSPVPRTDAGGDNADAGGEAAAPAGGVSGLQYYHEINKAESEQLIDGQPDGTFLLR